MQVTLFFHTACLQKSIISLLICVLGKIQTIYPWQNDASNPATEPPAVWFHDILNADGTAFNATEVKYIQSITRGKVL